MSVLGVYSVLCVRLCNENYFGPSSASAYLRKFTEVGLESWERDGLIDGTISNT